MGISLNISFLLGFLWLIACYQFRFDKLSRIKVVISQSGGCYPLSESVLFVSTREAELEQHVDMGLWMERVSWRMESSVYFWEYFMMTQDQSRGMVVGQEDGKSI